LPPPVEVRIQDPEVFRMPDKQIPGRVVRKTIVTDGMDELMPQLTPHALVERARKAAAEERARWDREGIAVKVVCAYRAAMAVVGVEQPDTPELNVRTRWPVIPRAILRLDHENAIDAVCAFEHYLDQIGLDLADIAEAIRLCFGGRATAEDIKSGNVWWRPVAAERSTPALS
jgi:hypothetical protein